MVSKPLPILFLFDDNFLIYSYILFSATFVQQQITSLKGGGVQIRINDVKANTQDVMALQPDEVVRVEYIDNPGVRYSDEGSVEI